MPRESQEAQLTKMRDRINGARSWRESEGYIELWRRMIDMYRGKQVESDNPEADEAMVNLCFSVLNIIVASVTTQYPKFTVSPNQMEHGDQATIAEAVLNYSWKHYEFQDEFIRAIIDMCMVGHGWLKIGWRYKEHTESQTLSPEDQMLQEQQGMAQADTTAALMGGGAPPSPLGVGGAVPPSPMGAPTPPEAMGQPNVPAIPGNPAELPSDQEIAAGVEPVQSQTMVDQDDPFVERCSPFDVVVDPDATCERELRWVAQRVIRDLQEVYDDETYDSRARHKVQADMSSAPDDAYDLNSRKQGLTNEEADRVTVWEFYDLQRNQWAVFAQSGEGFLVKPTDIPYDFKNCYVQFRDYDVPDTFYPMGEIEAVESLQEELNKTRTQQINARKQYVRKFIGREAALDPAARQALMSQIDGDVALITDDDRPLNDVIVPAPSLMFDPQIFIAHSGQIVNDLQMVTGLSDYQFGQMPDTRRLATEAMAVEGATNARAQYKLAKVERTLATVGRRLLQVMQQYLDTQRVARITGPGGELIFTFQPDDIRGEFDLEVEAGSTQPKNDMIRKQQAVTLFNTLAPMMGTFVDPGAAITYLLTEGFDIKGPERFLMQPAPPPPPGAPPGAQGQLPPGAEQGGMAPPGAAGQPPGAVPPIPEGGGAEAAPAPNGSAPPVPVGG